MGSPWEKGVAVSTKIGLPCAVALGIAMIWWTVAGASHPSMLTVGIVNLSPTLSATIDGFKAGMAERGFVEGQNTRYLYDGPTGRIEALEPAVLKLTEAKVDLLLAVSTPATRQAQQATRTLGIPVVFAPVFDPVGAGVVNSLRRPGANLTGIRGGGSAPKALEWLCVVVPHTERLYVLHAPKDRSSVQALARLRKAASVLGVELVVQDVLDLDEIRSLIRAAPQDIDAVFILSSGRITVQVRDVVEAAAERRLPVASTSNLTGGGALVTFGADYYRVGEQASRLAEQVLRGTLPSDLPIETADFFLRVNLRTARAIGLEVSRDTLRQADTVIR